MEAGSRSTTGWKVADTGTVPPVSGAVWSSGISHADRYLDNARNFLAARAGLLGAVLGAAILIVVLALILRGVYRLSTTRIPHESVGTTARLWIAAVSLATTAAVGFVPVPVSSAGVYWESGGELVTNLEAPTATDARVTLRRDGLFASKPLGTAIITDEVVDTTCLFKHCRQISKWKASQPGSLLTG